MFYRISTGGGMGCLSGFVWCAAVGIIPCSAYLFPWWAGRNSLPAVLGNWLAKALICFYYFRGQTGDFRRKSTKFPAGREKGNLFPPGKRVGVRAQLA
jgi:hypothetical protein